METRITYHSNDITIQQFIEELSTIYEIHFSYSNDYVPLEKRISLDAHQITLEQVLSRILDQTGISYRKIGNQIVLIYNEKSSNFNPLSNKIPEKIIFNKKPPETNKKQGSKDTAAREPLIPPDKAMPVSRDEINLSYNSDFRQNPGALKYVYPKDTLPKEFLSDTQKKNLIKVEPGYAYEFFNNSSGINFSVSLILKENYFIAGSYKNFQPFTNDRSDYSTTINPKQFDISFGYKYFLNNYLGAGIFTGASGYIEKTRVEKELIIVNLYGQRQINKETTTNTELYPGFLLGANIFGQYKRIGAKIKYQYLFQEPGFGSLFIFSVYYIF